MTADESPNLTALRIEISAVPDGSRDLDDLYRQVLEGLQPLKSVQTTAAAHWINDHLASIAIEFRAESGLQAREVMRDLLLSVTGWKVQYSMQPK